MQVEQFVMTYYAEQDRLRALLPEGFVSLRPVLRINAEVRDGVQGYVEFNTAAEKDNAGCFFAREGGYVLRPAEAIDQKKEFRDCEFSWEMEGGAHGVSEGKNLPAVPTPAQKNYPKEECTVENAARIPCRRVGGTYRAQFER